MIFKQSYESSLGHASYLIDSAGTGEALLVADVARPELLGDEARKNVRTPAPCARHCASCIASECSGLVRPPSS